MVYVYGFSSPSSLHGESSGFWFSRLFSKSHQSINSHGSRRHPRPHPFITPPSSWLKTTESDDLKSSTESPLNSSGTAWLYEPAICQLTDPFLTYLASLTLLINFCQCA